MGYKTKEEQVALHLAFLKSNNFAIEEVRVDEGFIRCHCIDKTTERGELCYQTKTTQLRNGKVGLGTWCRGLGGKVSTYQTYGLPFSNNNENTKNTTSVADLQKEIRKVELFWQMSDEVGDAEYLQKKGVGYYGVRFRQVSSDDNNYGKTAVIPMRDINGKLLSYQLINADGSKRFCKNTQIKDLLHILRTPIGKSSIGIAESYVTAATCYELTGMAMVTAFSNDNLKNVAMAIRTRFPDNPILIFGDNDRHLQENKGIKAALAIKKELGLGCSIVLPEFNGYPATKDFSDWNDLVREVGVNEARNVIRKALGSLV